MGAPKSVLVGVRVDCAKASHNCQRSKHHRVSKGDRRLKVRKERTHDHYCTECGIVMLEKDIERLKAVLLQLRGEADLDAEDQAE